MVRTCGVVARDVGERPRRHVDVHGRVLPLVGQVELVEVLRHVAVLEGQAERERQPVGSPRVQQAGFAGGHELDGLDDAGEANEPVPEPKEVQAGDGVRRILQRHRDGLRARE